MGGEGGIVAHKEPFAPQNSMQKRIKQEIKILLSTG